jgi:undecaprenyl diphosphate synthase
MTRNNLDPLPFDTKTLLKEIQEELRHYVPILLPQHVAIIPDGNRRWAKSQGLSFFEGYLQGSHTLMRTALTAKALRIPTLTVFTFSTENWKRPQNEQSLLMDLFIAHLQSYKECLVEYDIKLSTIGNKTTLPLALQTTIQEVEEATKKGSALTLVLAMNYGGRDEIIRALKKIASSQQLELLDENTFSKYLDTHAWPDPDLVIRTGGEQRISNFLLWQSSYAEMHVEPQYWPDFSPKNFISALEDFQKRSRRHGGGDA